MQPPLRTVLLDRVIANVHSSYADPAFQNSQDRTVIDEARIELSARRLHFHVPRCIKLYTWRHRRSEASGIHCVMYVAKFEEAIYVLHCF